VPTVRAAGLDDVIVTGDDIIEPKPRPHGILLPCERLGVPPRSAAYVGDTANDVCAARSSGAVAIVAAWNSNASTSDADRASS
jgi:phosphoglycolate phosphatase-like HAD superfamily hydrolase